MTGRRTTIESLSNPLVKRMRLLAKALSPGKDFWPKRLRIATRRSRQRQSQAIAFLGAGGQLAGGGAGLLRPARGGGEFGRSCCVALR